MASDGKYFPLKFAQLSLKFVLDLRALKDLIPNHKVSPEPTYLSGFLLSDCPHIGIGLFFLNPPNNSKITFPSQFS